MLRLLPEQAGLDSLCIQLLREDVLRLGRVVLVLLLGLDRVGDARARRACRLRGLRAQLCERVRVALRDRALVLFS